MDTTYFPEEEMHPKKMKVSPHYLPFGKKIKRPSMKKDSVRTTKEDKVEIMQKIEKCVNNVEKTTTHVTIKDPLKIKEETVVEVVRLNVGEKSPEKKEKRESKTTDSGKIVVEPRQIKSPSPLLQEPLYVHPPPHYHNVTFLPGPPGIAILPVSHSVPSIHPIYRGHVRPVIRTIMKKDHLPPLTGDDLVILNYVFPRNIKISPENKNQFIPCLFDNNKVRELNNYALQAVIIIKERITTLKKLNVRDLKVSDIFGNSLNYDFIDRPLEVIEIEKEMIGIFSFIVPELRGTFEGYEIIDKVVVNMSRSQLIEHLNQRKLIELKKHYNFTVEDETKFFRNCQLLDELRSGTSIIM